MDMGFEHLRPPSESDADGQEEKGRLDWGSLRARLAATHGLIRAEARDAAQAGSFAPSAARALATYGRDQQDVNPTGLAIGKPRNGIDDDVGGAPMPVDRGWE